MQLKTAGADTEAAEHLVGHAPPGERDTDVDPEAHPLRDAVNLVPKIGVPRVVTSLDAERDTREAAK